MFTEACVLDLAYVERQEKGKWVCEDQIIKPINIPYFKQKEPKRRVKAYKPAISELAQEIQSTRILPGYT